MLKGTLKKLSGSKKIKGLKKSKDDDSKVKKKKKKKEEEIELEEEEFEEEEVEEDDGEEVEFGDELEGALEDDIEEDTTSGKISEFENRIKDLENEVGLISSKLNTIRAENEEIGKRVQEIEENIRKLLGIYEIVTEGINPFATEVVGGEEGLGLFSFKKDKNEDVPEEILEKEPESFFEDVDDDEVEDASLDFDTEGIESKPSEKASESPEDTFKRLKEEMSKEKESAGEEISSEPEPETETVAEVPDEKEVNEERGTDVEGIKVEMENVKVVKSGPYLTHLKKDFVSDIIALKWMDYLVNTFGIKRMAEILDFYSDIGWISKNVKDLLINYSRGYVLREMQILDEPSTPTLRDHIRSLIFIAKLGGFELEIEEIEKVIKEIEDFEKETSEVITSEHAISSNC